MWYICLYESFPPDRFPGIVVYLFFTNSNKLLYMEIKQMWLLYAQWIIRKVNSKTKGLCVSDVTIDVERRLRSPAILLPSWESFWGRYRAMRLELQSRPLFLVNLISIQPWWRYNWWETYEQN